MVFGLESDSDSSGHCAPIFEEKSSDSQTPAIGVVRVVVQSAHVQQRFQFQSRPKPFVNMWINDAKSETSLASSLDGKIYIRTYNPNWSYQTEFLVVYSWDDLLHLDVLNHHRFWRPALIGSTTIALSRLKDQIYETGIHADLIKNAEQRGNILLDAMYYLLWLDAGVCRVEIHEAQGLQSLECPPDLLLPYVKISLGWDNAPIMTSPCCSFAKWKVAKDFICTDRRAVTLVVRVVDDRLNDPLLGHLSIPLSDVTISYAEQWWPLSGSAGARLGMTVHWGSLDLARHTVERPKDRLRERPGEIGSQSTR